LRSRPTKLGLAAVAGSLALLLAGVWPGGAAAAAAPGPSLSHVGRWITDAQGRVVIVHGTNMVYKLPPYDPAATGFGADDAAFLRRIGFNAVRVGVIWKALEPEPGVYDDRYLDSIEATVRTLAAHGILSLLEFHQDLYNERFQGEGAPDWAVQDDGLPAQPQLGFPANYYSMAALQHALEHFWENSAGPGGVGLQDRFAAAWQHVAQRFAGDPALLGYEIFNEPFPGKEFLACASATGCPAFDARLAGFYGRVDAAIRAADPRTLVWYEPNVLFNFARPTSLPPLADPRTGFAFHAYCLEGEELGCESHAGTMENADRYAASAGTALALTEFGATSSRLDLRQVTGLADQHMVSWLEWMYCGCSDPTTAAVPDDQATVFDPARPPTGSNVAAGTVRALSRPYPQAVSGTPRSWSFDPDSRNFTLRYGARSPSGHRFSAGAVTEIAAPATAYSAGYGARVAGGAVVSPPDAPILRVASCPRAATLTVRVGPRLRPAQGCLPRLRLRVRPRRARAGRPATYRFSVRAILGAYSGPLAGATVRLGRGHARTDRHGIATIRLALPPRSRPFTAVAGAPGFATGRVRLRRG
jgi:endoglycosylceramidase